MSGSDRRSHRGWLILGLALVAVGAAAILLLASRLPEPDISPTLAQHHPDGANGAYVAVLGDCAFCHTRNGGPPFAGGLRLATPLGAIYSSNITPDSETGIGHYTFKDFVRVMRFGVKPDGTRLYPAMPYTAYSKVSDDDLQDLFAYLRSQIVPVHQASRASDILWPLSMRWPLALWNIAFHDTSHFRTDASQDAQWNRGAYLVQGLAHCGTCHTPRGWLFEEKDVRGATTLFLSGALLDGTSPINLRGNDGDGLGRWSATDIAALLTSARNAHSAVTETMADVVRHSTQYMTDQDVAAIAVYLKSLSPAPGAGHASFTASDATLRTVMSGAERSSGGRIYMDSCAACHRLSGMGEDRTFPTLAGNPSVLSADPSSLIAVILNGARTPSTSAAPTGLAMPGFGWRYDDADVAELATFVRSSWGNGGEAVAVAQVARVRKQIGLSRPNP
jgi:mono/diheme cytochrome c family protein